MSEFKEGSNTSSTDSSLGAGLIRTRHYFPAVTRRQFCAGLASAAALAMMPRGPAYSATNVTFMGWQDYDTALNANDWLAKNNVNLQPTYIGTNEEIISSAASGGIGNLDIATPAAIYLNVDRAADVLEPIDLSRIPNWENMFPIIKNFASVDEDNTVLGLPFVWGYVPLMYNADVISEKPDSWRALTDKKYKGKVGLVEDVMGQMVHSPLTATNTSTPTQITQEQLDATIDWLIKIKKEYAYAVVPTYGELASLFTSRDVLIAPAWTPTVSWAGEEAPSLDWVIPKEGCLAFVDFFSMIRNPPHKDLDYKILNRSLSPEAQATCANSILTGVTVRDAVPLLDEAARNLYPYDDISGWFKKAGGPFPPWPATPNGDILGYRQIMRGWERFLQA